MLFLGKSLSLVSEIAAGCRIEPEGKAWVDDTIIVQSLTEGLWHSRVQLHAVSQMLVLPTINSKLPSVYRQIPVPPLTGKGQHRMGIRQLLHQSRDATLGGSTGYHHLERKPFTSCACMIWQKPHVPRVSCYIKPWYPPVDIQPNY